MSKKQTHLIAKKVCEQYPNTPTLTLAKKLFAEHSEVYLNIEHARSAIRYIRGKTGNNNRKTLADKSLMETKPREYNPFKLPKSYAKKRQHIDVKGSKILVLSDVHIPYHDVEALTLAIDFGIQEKCDTIILNGDALDCHMISDFVKDPKKRKFSEELYAMRTFLFELRQAFPNATIYYKEGNHEERYWRYMRVKAPELFDIDAFDFPTLTHCDKNRVIWIDGKSKLMLVH